METGSPKALIRAFVIQAVLTGITVVSGIVTVFKEAYLWVGIVLAILVVAAQFYLFYEAVLAKRHRFKGEDDAKFSTFFTNWYGQEGEHRVFCKDLDWLDKDAVANVKSALVRQGPRVKIFVSDDGAKAVTDIRLAGGKVFRVPEEMVRIQMKFSLHSVDSSQNLIVRRKVSGSKGVRFAETRDQLVLGLASTVMAACAHIADPSQK